MALSTTRVTNVDGEIIALTRDGVRTFLLPDPQGNVVGEIDSAQQVVNRTSYWPYGEIRTGKGHPFGYVGTLGYHRHRHVLGAWTDPQLYVRARWLDPFGARWLTPAPLWPMERPYAYVNGNPTTWVDPMGTYTVQPAGKPCTPGTVVIFPGETDGIAIVVGPPASGLRPGTVIHGGDAISLFPGWRPDMNCVAINGSLCATPTGGWKPGKPSSPVFDVTDCYGNLYPGAPGAGVAELTPTPVIVGPGRLCGVQWPSHNMQPSATLPRTGACVDSRGKLLGLVVAPKPPGASAAQFQECMKARCPKGTTPVFLDGGASTQVIQRPAGRPLQTSIAWPGIDGRPSLRPVHDWIVICEK